MGRYKLDKLLKLQLQNNLEILFNKEYLTKEEVNEVLQISEKALNSLFKTIQSKQILRIHGMGRCK